MDKTEVEKLEEQFKRIREEQDQRHHREIAMTLETAECRLRDLKETYEERKQELLTQNDGLLGAVGRLHAENGELKKKISVLEPALQKAREQGERLENEMHRFVGEAEERAREMIEKSKTEAKMEINFLKEKLAECQGRKKKGKD